WTGLVREQPCRAGHSTLSRETSNPAQGGEQPCPVGQPNLDNLKTNLKANLGSATAEAGSLVRALDRSVLARPPKPSTHQDWWRALQKEFNLEHVQLERIAGTTVYLVARSPNEAQGDRGDLRRNSARTLALGVSEGERHPVVDPERRYG